MACGPITSRQIEGEKAEGVIDFIFLGYKITATVTTAMKLKDTPWKESYDKPRQCAKSRDITLLTKVHACSQAMVFPVVMCGCESWTIKKAK